jgi:hypothetical protein
MRQEITGEFKIINNWLRTFGRNEKGEPLFKLVWSDNETELRYGTFSDFHDSIFLREVTETRRVQKYNYISERWVLEKWLPLVNREVPESAENGMYEPFWVFQDRAGNYLQPTMKAVQFLIEFCDKVGRVPSSTRAAELKQEDEEAFEKEISRFQDELDCSPMLNALSLNDGVGYSGKVGKS